jgi:hypothetical protein
MKKTLLGICLWAALAGGGCATGGPAASPQGAGHQDLQVYELYRQYMETLNEQRRRAGAPPLPIRTYEAGKKAPGTGESTGGMKWDKGANFGGDQRRPGGHLCH